MKTMEWRVYETKFGPNPLLLKLGRITLGAVTWKGPEKYSAICDLPCLANKGNLGEFKTEEDAKDYLHQKVIQWFKEGGIS